MNKVVRTTVALISAAALWAGVAGTAIGATNPSGTGQPSASCGSDNASMMPAGFSTRGFAKAGAVYAGSDGTASAMHANSGHAVSQYDVACYQVTQNAH